MRTSALLCTLLLFFCTVQAKDKKKKDLPRAVGVFTPDLDPQEGKKKPKKEEVTQVLSVPKEPPAAVVADVERVVYFSSDLSAKGLLSQQTRDGIRSLLQKSKGAAIIKIRAFVAGSGDLRRVQAIVSEVFEERKISVPVITTVQVGALPLEGAQVLLEAVGVDRKVQNEHGLMMLSGHPARKGAEADELMASLRKQKVEATAVQCVTCFLNHADHSGEVKRRLASTFPNASINVVQTQRLPAELFEECEAAAALPEVPRHSFEFVDGIPGSFSKVVLLAPGKLAFSGLQLAFRNENDDVRLAFVRLNKSLETVGAKLGDSVFTNFYPVTRSVGDKARKLRFEFYGSASPPASTLLLFEGLPSLDAILGVESVAVVR